MTIVMINLKLDAKWKHQLSSLQQRGLHELASSRVRTTASASLASCRFSTLKFVEIAPEPGVEALNSPGQTAQFRARAANQMRSGGPTQSDVTRSVTWATSNASVAKI
jgi:hypothetical protein